MGCVVLTELAVIDEIRAAVAKLGGVDIVLSVVMQSHPSSSDVVLHACILLDRLAADKDTDVKTCIPTIISCIKTIPSHSSKVVEICFRILWRLTSRKYDTFADNRSSINILGGVELALDAIRQRHDDVLVMSNACGLLANLALNNTVIDKLMDCENSNLIMSCLHSHIGYVDVIHPVCCLLGNMHLATNANIDKFMTLEKMRDLAAALRAHGEKTAIAESICFLLHKCSRRKRHFHDVWIAVVDIVEVEVLRVLHCHHDNLYIARHGCAVLRSGGATILVLEAVLNAIRAPNSDAAVVVNGCEALHCMANDNFNFKRTMVTHGTISIVVGALQLHALSEAVVEVGCAVLYSLSRVSSHTIVFTEAIAPILDCLKNHVDSVAVAKHCCGALARSACTEGHVSDISDDKYGGIPAILRTLERHKTDATLVEYACCAILNLICKHTANRAKVKKNGGKQIFQEIANKYPEVSFPEIKGFVKCILKLLPLVTW